MALAQTHTNRFSIFEFYKSKIVSAIFFYVAFPFIYLIAHLPYRWLFVLSDGLYYIMRLIGYRSQTIRQNLQRSFPEKSRSEINQLFTAYYRFMCDLILETLKTMTITEKEVQEHCHFHKPEWLTQLYNNHQSFIIVMGHYGNWELAGPSFSLNNQHQLMVIYRPLSNPYFEQLFVNMRTRFGTKIVPPIQTLRAMVAHRNQLTATAFIADQKASADQAYWTTFLNQDTAVFTGPEKLAKKFKYPIVYVSVNKIKRGYYEVLPELLFENVQNTQENEISETFIRRLEKEIQANPSTWLWSHRRWKDKRPHP